MSNGTPEVEIDEFASGYSGAEVPVSAETLADNPEGLDAVANVEDIAPKADAPAGQTPAEPVVPATPKMREISEEEYARMMAAPAELREEFTRKLDSVFGRIGSTEQLLKSIQSTTPRGEVPKLTKEDMGKFGENYEYMSDDLLDTLNTVLGKLHGTAPSAPAMDPDAISSLVSETLQRELPNVRAQVRTEVTRELGKKAVLDKHPDADNLFATKEVIDFMATLPAERQQILNDPVTGWEPKNVIAFLDDFKKATKPAPQPQPSNVTSIARKAALKAIVNPNSAAGAPRAQTEDDEFAAGYNASQAK